MTRSRQFTLLNLILVLTLVATLTGWVVERRRLKGRIKILEYIVRYDADSRELKSYLDEQEAMAHPVVIDFEYEPE